MSSAEAQVVYQKQDGLSGLEEQQSAFTEQFDVEDPEQAKSDYQRYELLHIGRLEWKLISLVD